MEAQIKRLAGHHLLGKQDVDTRLNCKIMICNSPPWRKISQQMPCNGTATDQNRHRCFHSSLFPAPIQKSAFASLYLREQISEDSFGCHLQQFAPLVCNGRNAAAGAQAREL